MGYTVFLAEDDLRLRDELSALLERYGYRCLFPAGFEDLAGQILSSGAQLVLLDLGLPRYDGYHVCRDLRARSAQLPIMIVTSRSDELDELMSMNLGADDFITKPFNPQILLARMARLLQRAYPSGGGASGPWTWAAARCALRTEKPDSPATRCCSCGSCSASRGRSSAGTP